MTVTQSMSWFVRVKGGKTTRINFTLTALGLDSGITYTLSNINRNYVVACNHQRFFLFRLIDRLLCRCVPPGP